MAFMRVSLSTFLLACFCFPFPQPVFSEDAAGFIWVAGAQDDGDFSADWYTSDFAIQRDWMRTGWRRSARQLEEDALVLRLSPDPDPAADKEFVGAEVQRRQTSGYGRYEVVMTPARGEGVISSFFTYTGPGFGQPHDEIDIEFLGRDTTKIWAMAFHDGKKLPGAWLDLGFDAAEGPRLYAFEWQPDRIVWYVEGAEIFRITSDDAALPDTAGKLYLNIWAGGPNQKNWSGAAAPDTTAEARYFCLSHQPTGRRSPQCSDGFDVD